MSKVPVEVFDLSDVATKRRLLQRIQMLKGLHEVSIRPRKLTRTLNQNSYYWSAVVGPFTQWLQEEWGDRFIAPEQAHEMLKHKILPAREMIDKDGEVISLPATTRTLDTKEFGEYVDQCAAWLAEFTGIVVLPPEAFYEPAPAKRSLKQDLGESIIAARAKKRSA